ncbi:TetR/AcrR family transcriptional regulator [Clostridium oryzae]|uniref:Nucleoid occlusion factor SlmA n=1 Tax=Clostridium oryzae TaxID=1450648 RepID=A0A1V4IHB4_9CLOT|nr:TetR/AcrR family transcriptional regulator [Clostridium oryzae]OPJ59388.1 nucleoid occlusion factor SlmA [Clostridium oryzae]
MNKREIIIKTMYKLLLEDKGASCSVSDIAKEAGIGKGSIYYYFKSKDEIFDAVVEHIYKEKIDKCKEAIDNKQINALEKLKLLFDVYGQYIIEPSIDSYLHKQQNAAIHQKSLAQILNLLSPIVADIFSEGVNENLFSCENPQETAELFLSAFCFLLDPGIFVWSDYQVFKKIEAMSDLFEKGLSAPKGSFIFLCEKFKEQP